MPESTTKETAVTSTTKLPADYQTQNVVQPPRPLPKESACGLAYPSAKYTAAKVTTSAERVAFVVNVGTTPKEEFIREVNAKIEGSTSPRSTVSSES